MFGVFLATQPNGFSGGVGFGSCLQLRFGDKPTQVVLNMRKAGFALYPLIDKPGHRAWLKLISFTDFIRDRYLPHIGGALTTEQQIHR